MAEGGSENPNLKDNWDDAEGYYRKSGAMYTCECVVQLVHHTAFFPNSSSVQVFVLESSWIVATLCLGTQVTVSLATWCEPEID